MSFEWQELIGYLASALVVTSLSMSSVVRLRMFSLAGSATFLTYGVLIESVPIIITNLAIACLNLWFLSRELGGHRDLGAVVVPVDSPFLNDFLSNHADEIASFQPDYPAAQTANFALVLTREGLPAGAVAGVCDGDTLHITLDYVLKAYRDSRLGQWLYSDGAGAFTGVGIERCETTATTASHRAYLEGVGFESGDDDVYRRQLAR